MQISGKNRMGHSSGPQTSFFTFLHWKKIDDYGQSLKTKLERNLVIGFGKIESAEILWNNRFGKKLLRNQQNFIKMNLAKFVPVSVKLGFIFGKIGPFFHQILGEKQRFSFY